MVKIHNKTELSDSKRITTQALVDSAPGYQETLKPPSGGFSFGVRFGLNQLLLCGVNQHHKKKKPLITKGFLYMFGGQGGIRTRVRVLP